MTTRATVKATLRSFLGAAIDDPFYGDTAGVGVSPSLDPIVQQALDSLLEDIYAQSPAFAPKVASLVPTSATAHTYALASQTPSIIDFSHWLKVRYDDQDGAELDEVPWEQLSAIGASYFAIVGADSQTVLETSQGTDAGHPLWMQYGFRPADLASDSSPIPLIPAKFQDVVALEALFAFELGGESVRPPALHERWLMRRARLMARIGRRGMAQRRTRLDADVVNSYR